MEKQLQKTNRVKAYLENVDVQEKLRDVLKNKTTEFIASLLSATSSNELLVECEPGTVFNAALTAASLGLPINQNLGFAYIIPYKNKSGKYEAQFQMGYKGYIQLAQRSGLYRTINATDVKEGELKGKNRLTGEVEFEWIDNDEERAKLSTVGYLAFFETTTGFQKTRYMSKSELESHGKKFSQSFKRGYGLWKDDFDSMAIKTVIKLLISKYGPMTTELGKAVELDQAVVEGEVTVYPDNYKDKPEIPEKTEEDKKKIKDEAAKLAEELAGGEEKEDE